MNRVYLLFSVFVRNLARLITIHPSRSLTSSNKRLVSKRAVIRARSPESRKTAHLRELHHLCWSECYAARSGWDRLDLPLFDLLFLSQPSRFRATAMQAARNSSARARSTMVRATVMPPMDKAAMLCAVVRRRRPFWIKLRSKTLTIALKRSRRRAWHLRRCGRRRSAMRPWGRSFQRPRNAGEIDRRGQLAALRQSMTDPHARLPSSFSTPGQ